MIKYCPIISFQKQYKEENMCMEGCAFADETGECLIRQALIHYIGGDRRKEEYELLHKDGGRTSIDFNQSFEDALEAYKRIQLYPQPDFRPPAEIK
jgi:hypothetical protein